MESERKRAVLSSLKEEAEEKKKKAAKLTEEAEKLEHQCAELEKMNEEEALACLDDDQWWLKKEPEEVEDESGGNRLLKEYMEKVVGMDVAPEDQHDHAFYQLCKEAIETSIKDGNRLQEEEGGSKGEHYKEAGTTGQFDMRSVVGQYWARCLKRDDDLKEKYEKATGRKAKRLFREKWAKDIFSQVDASKSFEENFQEINTTEGRYYTLGGLVDSYGGWAWPPAVRAGKLHASKAARMGGKWVFIESMSELPHFFKHEHVCREIMSKKWAEFVQWTSKDDAGSANHEQEPEPDEEEPKAKAKGEPKAKEKAKAKGKAGGQVTKAIAKEGDDDEDDEIEKAVMGAFKEAGEVKAQYEKVDTASSRLIGQFESNEDYAWGNNEATKGKLQSLRDKINEKAGAFGKEFMLHDSKKIRGLYEKSVLLDHLRLFATLKNDLADLKAETDKAIRRHGA